MNTRPSLVTLHTIQVIAPIHGTEGPCSIANVPRLADALTLHRYLPGALLIFSDGGSVRYQFGANPPQFIDPLIQESEPDGYDLTATLLNLEARVLLGHYETQAAVDAAYSALLDYAAWDPTASPDQTVQSSTPSPCSQGEGAGGEGPSIPIGTLDYPYGIRLQNMKWHIGSPRVQLEAVDEARAALRGIFHVHPELPGMANHQWAFDCLETLHHYLRRQVQDTPPPCSQAEGAESQGLTPNGTSFVAELARLVNQFSREQASNTPDSLLAEYLTECLTAYNKATVARDNWYGVHLQPGNSYFLGRKATTTKVQFGVEIDGPNS